VEDEDIEGRSVCSFFLFFMSDSMIITVIIDISP